jgi:hypothetical protein
MKVKKVFKKITNFFKYAFLTFFSLLIIISTIVYYKKDAIISSILAYANADFKGLIQIKDANISAFKTFPYVSVKLSEFQLYETKSIDTTPILNIKNVYVGFNAWHLVKQDYRIKKIVLENGNINIVQYVNNELNIAKAFESNSAATADTSTHFTLELSSVNFKNIDVKKTNLATSIIVEAAIANAKTSLKKNKDSIALHVDAAFLLNVFKNQQPTYIYHKHFELFTDLSFNKSSHIINFKKSSILLEGAEFGFTGNIDVDNEMDVNMDIYGNKPNFDLLIAFAPEDLIPVLKTYDNRGQVYFSATLKGKTINNNTPAIEANFGCKDGFVKNKEANKILDELGFNCSFSNGSQRNASTSVFTLKDFGARPEAGKFKAALTIKNFNSPEIDMQLDSDFDLQFLTQFFKLKNLSNLTGKVLLSMKFHDIIDLQQPEKALEKFNQAYFTKLNIQNLNFQSDKFHLPFNNVNVDATVTGENLSIDNFSFLLGKSDLKLIGKIKNIPAVIHQLPQMVDANLSIQSNKIDLEEMMPKQQKKSMANEVLSNVKFNLKVKSKANTFLTSKSLPIGNYYLTNISAQLKNYNHALNGLNGICYITDNDILVKQLDGKIDKSDFHFKGKINNYSLWLLKDKVGTTYANFDLTSKEIHFKDLFVYKGTNYMPADYRNEDLKDLTCKGKIKLTYNQSLQSTDFYLTELSGLLKLHPLRVHHFNGNIHVEKDVLNIKSFSGYLGNNDFNINGYYHLNDSLQKHYLNFYSKHINVSEILNFSLPNSTTNQINSNANYTTTIDLPNLALNATVNDLVYNKYQFSNLVTKLTLENNVINVSTLKGNIGSNDFNISALYHLNNKTKINELSINANNINLNEFIEAETVDSSISKDHDAGYNIFKEPFPNVLLKLKVKDFTFKKYKLADIIGTINVRENHYVNTDKLQFKTAGGLVEIKGYVNASNPQQIYLNPYIKFQRVDMDQLLIKLDNFGQDMLVSENVHGLLSGKIKGIIKLHTDFTPILNKAELQMDFKLENGRLDKFAPMQALSDYFGNKNLNRVRFDTLENRFIFKNGQLSFPNMVINSSLGYIELSGTQSMDLNMDYYIRVPLKLVGKAAFNKLFKKKPKEISAEQEDELIMKDIKRRTRFINVRIVGKPEDYKISLQKNKDIKAGKGFSKTDDFLFQELESEFED